MSALGTSTSSSRVRWFLMMLIKINKINKMKTKYSYHFQKLQQSMLHCNRYVCIFVTIGTSRFHELLVVFQVIESGPWPYSSVGCSVLCRIIRQCRMVYNSILLKCLRYWQLVTNMCIIQLGRHWFEQWLVDCSVQIKKIVGHFVSAPMC